MDNKYKAIWMVAFRFKTTRNKVYFYGVESDIESAFKSWKLENIAPTAQDETTIDYIEFVGELFQAKDYLPSPTKSSD